MGYKGTMARTNQPAAVPRRSSDKAAVRGPRKMTARRLENIALFYLQRFSTTAAQLSRVLSRRVDRAIRVHGESPEATRADMMGWVTALVERLVRSGAVDDDTFAAGRTATMRQLGKGPGRIRSALAAKGVAAGTIARVIAETATNADGSDAALAAALAYARRRRLGPFREGPRDRDSDRKDMGALARAGFSLETARAVLTSDAEDP